MEKGATFVTGKMGEAFSFDGVDDAVRIPFDPAPGAFTACSVEAWVDPDFHPFPSD